MNVDVITAVTKRYDYLEEVTKYNPYHGSDGRFSSAGGGSAIGAGSVSSGGFDAKGAQDKLNAIGLKRINGGAKKDDYKILGETLHSAPVGTVLTTTHNRGAKLQYTKTKDGDSKREDEWKSLDGYKSSSHTMSMTWAGSSTGAFEFKFDTKDTAPTGQEVRDSQLNATLGQLKQWNGGR